MSGAPPQPGARGGSPGAVPTPRVRRSLGANLTHWATRLAIWIGSLGLAVAAGFAAQAWWRLPDLQAWHTVRLQQEFAADEADAPRTFRDYLALEERLFEELARKLYADPDAADTLAIGRYNPTSPVARIALDTTGNRSHELAPAGPVRGAALLLHGLSDAPYSLDAVGRLLQARGLHVVSLRLPGHGTIPSALVDVHHRDWRAAVALAARHAAAQAPGKPFYIAGYSTGAPLALLYALHAQDDVTTPMPTRLFLFSPAIGISDFAVMTNFASLLAFVPGLGKARWLDVLPEYDPYKFNSFPVNAANQIWGLTRALERAAADAAAQGRMEAMPPVLAFQSLVDSTVTAADVGSRLFARLPAKGHELVVFDVNRQDALTGLLAKGPMRAFDALANVPALPFRLTIVGNRSGGTGEVVEHVREAGSRETQVVARGLAWPADLFSLGHLAVPVPPDDPLYGLDPPRGRYSLGRAVPRGESGALVLPLGGFARIRSNPFFPVIVDRIDAAVAADLR